MLWLLLVSVVVGNVFEAEEYSEYVEPKKAGVYLTEVTCRLDPRINAETIGTYQGGIYLEQIRKYLWATACGRSRGVFTLTNSKDYAGNTYSCANWPSQWGINYITDWFSDPSLYAKHIEYLDLYLQGNYNTTAVHGPATCDFAGFSLTSCGASREAPYKKAPWADRINGKPFRGVNTGGVFVLEPWITPTFTNWTLELADEYTYAQQNPTGSPGYNRLVDHWNNWYTPQDFQRMKAAGLNAIRIPVGWWFFAKEAGFSPEPYLVPSQSTHDPDHPLTKFIKMATQSGLMIVLDLHGAPGSQNGLDNSGQRSKDPQPARWGFKWFYDKVKQAQTTQVLVQMAKYIMVLENEGIDNVVALELLNEPWVFDDMAVVRDWYRTTIQAIRTFSEIPIIIHDAFRHAEWDWLLTDWPFKDIYMDTHLYHAFNPDDIASSTPNCDKNKMIVATNIACGYGSLLRFKTCISLPTFVGEWSLANDDCMGMIRGSEKSVQFEDFGQCKNLKQRLGDPWWTDRYQRFAYKQMAMAERELGWFFWTWKLGPGTESDPSTPYWSYYSAIQAGIIPQTLNNTAITEACYLFDTTEPYTC